MSDIIANAQQLLEHATPGTWKHFADRGAVSLTRGSVPIAALVFSGDAELIAAAPEMARELSEETWEYSAQDKRGEDWETFTNSETHIEEWWADKDDAEWAAIISQEQGHETRLVRRRVSPVEVCE